MKFEDVKVPHTRLIEVDLQKPRNLSAHESEEYDHGEGAVRYTLPMSIGVMKD